MPITPPINLLLDGLARKERDRILAFCEPAEVVFGDILCEPDRPFQHVYFPLTAFISMVLIIDTHPPLEMGLIGNEGMLGATLILGIRDCPLRAVVQGSGSVLRMKIPQFRLALREGPSLVKTVNRYLYVLMAQLSQTAACTYFHEVEPRLARWLLMTHDRAHAEHFHLTHQYLANMLGVQRSAVTIAAGALQNRNLISYTRGEINILDRIGLEAASCRCYEAGIEDYTRQFA